MMMAMIISIIRIFWTMCPSFLFVVFLSYYDISVCFVWGKIMTLSVLFICFVYSQHKPVWTITTMMKMRPRPLFPKRREMIFLCRNTSYTPCYTMLHVLHYVTHHITYYIFYTICFTVHHVTPCYTMLHMYTCCTHVTHHVTHPVSNNDGNDFAAWEL